MIRSRRTNLAHIVANQRRRARFAIRYSDPCMRNALMGNTCYVVATVTAADWRMTIGFRALLMAVCRRPSPLRSLTKAPDLRSESSRPLSPIRLRDIGCSSSRRPGVCAAKLFTEISRFSRPNFVHPASEILFQEHIARIDRHAIQITLQFNARFHLFRRVEKIM